MIDPTFSSEISILRWGEIEATIFEFFIILACSCPHPCGEYKKLSSA